MNTANQTFESMSGIRSLRSRNFDSKPLLVSAVSAVKDTLAFVGRMASCKNEMQLDSELAVANKDQRFVMNAFGKWTLAKN